MLQINSPAKINLVLEVLSKRDDGFHEISSVIAPISLQDKITISKSKKNTVKFVQKENSNFDNAIIQMEQIRTLLTKKTNDYFPVNIVIHKIIPSPGGLGGISSNMASLIIGLNNLWNINLSINEMKEIALNFGNDTLFFLRPVLSSVTGRGEIIRPIHTDFNLYLTIIPMPDAQVPSNKTKTLYSQVVQSDMTAGQHANKFIHSIETNNIILEDSFNTFESVIKREYPKQHLQQVNIEESIGVKLHVTGTGPTLYCYSQTLNEAQKIADDLKSLKIQSFVTKVL